MSQTKWRLEEEQYKELYSWRRLTLGLLGFCLQLSATPAYQLFTAIYEEDGRRFHEVGSYDHSKLHLSDGEDMFPNVKFGLNGRHLIVSVNYVRNFFTRHLWRRFEQLSVCRTFVFKLAEGE